MNSYRKSFQKAIPRDDFARAAVLTEFRPRDGRRGLNQSDFVVRAPDEQPQRLGDIAAEFVSDIGHAALDYWLREAARIVGEQREAAIEIAREIAGMIRVDRADLSSGKAA